MILEARNLENLGPITSAFHRMSEGLIQLAFAVGSNRKLGWYDKQSPRNSDQASIFLER